MVPNKLASAVSSILIYFIAVHHVYLLRLEWFSYHELISCFCHFNFFVSTCMYLLFLLSSSCLGSLPLSNVSRVRSKLHSQLSFPFTTSKLQYYFCVFIFSFACLPSDACWPQSDILRGGSMKQWTVFTFPIPTR